MWHGDKKRPICPTSGKEKFETEWDIQRDIDRSGKKLKYYFCIFCEHYHKTSK